MGILDETQEQRDLELHQITDVSLEEIRSYEIAAPDYIRIYDGGDEPQTEEEYIALYGKYRYLNLTGYLRTLMYTSVYRRGEILPGILRATQGCICLDFGSGVGTHAIALLENGNTVDILDVFGPLIEFAIKRIDFRGLNSNMVFLGDEELPQNWYDLIICTDVLEHVYSPMKELDRMRRALKKGGKLFLEVSQMIKFSSGHFPHSVHEWLREGPAYMAKYFEYQDGCWIKK